MIITASKLREDIYNVLDRALETGTSIEIQRKGKILRIVPPAVNNKLSRLKKHDALVGDLEDIVHMDWSDQWKN